MTANNEQRVWLNPPKFWAATKHMRQEEAEQFLNSLLRMAENREFDRLRQFEFISVGIPTLKKHVA